MTVLSALRRRVDTVDAVSDPWPSDPGDITLNAPLGDNWPTPEEINQYFPDNGTGLITAEVMRDYAQQVSDQGIEDQDAIKNTWRDRDSLVNAWSDGWVDDGQYIATMDGTVYRGLSGATDVPDLPGLIPAITIRMQHMGVLENTQSTDNDARNRVLPRVPREILRWGRSTCVPRSAPVGDYGWSLDCQYHNRSHLRRQVLYPYLGRARLHHRH